LVQNTLAILLLLLALPLKEIPLLSPTLLHLLKIAPPLLLVLHATKISVLAKILTLQVLWFAMLIKQLPWNGAKPTHMSSELMVNIRPLGRNIKNENR
jgi:hypothetical protein